MARYFLDTGAVVGVTFLHDLWFTDSRRIFDSENSFYLTPPVVYEYCNSTDDNLLRNTDIDWDTEEGLFGKKLSAVRAAQINLDLKLRSADDDDLSIESLTDDFLEESRVEEKVDERSINEYIRPNIRRFIEYTVDGRELTSKVAREVMDVLCDTIQSNARDTREEIQNRVTEYSVPSDERDHYKERFSFVDGFVDTVILSDVTWLDKKGVLSKIVTSDGSHMYGNRDRIDTVAGLTVLFIKDELADASLPG